MTFALVGALIGALFGALRARRARGSRLDQLQYAAVYGILGAVLGMFAAVSLVRSV